MSPRSLVSSRRSSATLSPRSVSVSISPLGSSESSTPPASSLLSRTREATFGVCSPASVLIVAAEPLLQRQQPLLQAPTSPKRQSGAVQSPGRWKRASASPLAYAEPLRAAAKPALMEFDSWPSMEDNAASTVDTEALSVALKSHMMDQLAGKRTDMTVLAMPTPPVTEQLSRSSNTSGRGIFADATDHVPIGVLVVQLKSQVVLFVRTIPFGSLECMPHENHVDLLLSRREDSLGQSHMTKWENLQMTSLDELSQEKISRMVLLPATIDPSSQNIRMLEHGVIRIEYAIVASAGSGGNGSGKSGLRSGSGIYGAGSGGPGLGSGGGRRSIFKRKEAQQEGNHKQEP